MIQLCFILGISSLPPLFFGDDNTNNIHEDDGNLLYTDHFSTYDSTPAYMGNVSFDHAWQVNGNLEAVDWETMACVQYKNNQAHGHSLQINGPMGLESLQAILQSRP